MLQLFGNERTLILGCRSPANKTTANKITFAPIPIFKRLQPSIAVLPFVFKRD